MKNRGVLTESEARRFLLLWGRDPSDPIDPLARTALQGASDPESFVSRGKPPGGTARPESRALGAERG
jgi:hypothetical protein